jgi:2-isopropylmalate synthase
VLADRLTYEIMRSEDVGAAGSQIVLGKHSGRHAFFKAVEELGHSLSDAEGAVAFQRFKELADRKGLVSSEDLEAILVSAGPADTAGDDRLVSIRVASATGETPRAEIVLELHGDPEVGTEPRQVAVDAEGDGMVDAVCKAIRAGLGRPDVRLGTYQVGAVTGGLDALAEVLVTVADEMGATVPGRGVSTDVVEASGLAYLDALNRSRRLVTRGAEFRA